jgi:hypothetical protein
VAHNGAGLGPGRLTEHEARDLSSLWMLTAARDLNDGREAARF